MIRIAQRFGLITLLVAAAASPLPAAPDGERPQWDQKRAVEMVQRTLDAEAAQAWEKIPWVTNLEEAVARAQREDKPLFIYWYVVKGGPKASPC